MKMAFIVGLGGFLGSIARYLIQKYFSIVAYGSFPFPTFLINLAGCFLIGFLYGLSNKFNVMSVETRMFLTTGFCGGFTTFSTFSNESLQLLKDGNLQYFLLYVLLSLIVGLFFTFLGYSIFK